MLAVVAGTLPGKNGKHGLNAKIFHREN